MNAVQAPTGSDRAATLVRRQLIVTALGIALVLVVLAFARSQQPPDPSSPVEVYVAAHRPPDPGNVHLAYLQLGLAATLAVLALGHAAHVAFYVFRRKAL